MINYFLSHGIYSYEPLVSRIHLQNHTSDRSPGNARSLWAPMERCDRLGMFSCFQDIMENGLLLKRKKIEWRWWRSRRSISRNLSQKAKLLNFRSRSTGVLLYKYEVKCCFELGKEEQSDLQETHDVLSLLCWQWWDMGTLGSSSSFASNTL